VRGALAGLAAAVVLGLASDAQGFPVTLTPRVGLSEEYNDNIFFTQQKDYDFITRLYIGMGIDVQSQYSNTTINLGTSAVYLARNTNTTINAAEAQRINLATAYQWSPSLTFNIYDTFARVGDTRDIGFATGAPGTALPPPQQETDPSGNNPGDVNILLPQGTALTNSFGITANYLFHPRWSTNLTYANGISDLTDPDDIALTQRWGLQLGYQWSPTLSVGPGFAYSRFNTTDAPDSEAYTTTVGANYQLSELWNAFGSIGGSVTRDLEGPSDTRASTAFTIGLNRAFQASYLTVGAQQGITPSAGIGGASTTLGGYLSYGIQLTQNLGGNLNFTYTHFDTTSRTNNVYQLYTGIFYPIWRNIGAGLIYSYRRSDAAQPAATFPSGVIDSNAVRLQLGWSSPWWQFDL
jgi:hypothetical protein